MQGFLCSLAIIDICKEEIPGGYFVFRIPHWEPTYLEPSINAIGASTTVLNLIDMAGFNAFLTGRDYSGKIIGMHRADERPVLQLLICSAEILQRLSVEKLDFARRAHR